MLSLLVAAGAVVGAGALRLRADRTTQAASTSAKAANPAGSNGCLQEPCRVLGHATIAGTVIELMADAGSRSGRLSIGGTANSGWVIPATVTDNGVVLNDDSLQCVAGGTSACLIRGVAPDNRMFGQTVVGRSDSWASGQTYVSNAGYLALANVDIDTSPEVLAAQHVCADGCATGPIRVQVFELDGSLVRCTRPYATLERLPGYPVVKLSQADLTPCKP
ncbi:hypothetical protein [Actinophytocola sp.]|uniref:hypothetical protein n=1 Tax=Actinophytocola sp. TaxID=1872138 RepID=UPI002D7F53C0|nr:hypothetical protein [Actinophytocola sp.]